MGWWGDFQDDVLGIGQPDPVAPGQDAYSQYLAKVKAEEEAAKAAAQVPVAPAPVAPAPVAPAPVVPQGPVFDPTPYRNQVDTGFSQFTPEFYANKYASFYDPYKSGVEGQYGAAKDVLTSGLAKKGLANSSQSRGLFQQLDALRDQTLNTGQSTAQGYQSSLTGEVGKAKEGLYGSIGEGADNASIGSRAQSEASRIAGMKAPDSSLGDIFGSLVTPYANQRSPGGPVNPELQAFSPGGTLNLANVGGGPQASAKVVETKKKKF
jgi:hypothetical protein